jgi:hypothetical protein
VSLNPRKKEVLGELTDMFAGTRIRMFSLLLLADRIYWLTLLVILVRRWAYNSLA